ncbi:hypothetical protein X777_04586 [Ooceraea biroi]|uniref:Uncharacterized protein n=1 Tax=Ooceraea biroi TaxID=2015173 RepID=A0A026X3M5_OOCBI|nr:hypothetical protein X777_04586 [Ooceraea biroi]
MTIGNAIENIYEDVNVKAHHPAKGSSVSCDIRDSGRERRNEPKWWLRGYKWTRGSETGALPKRDGDSPVNKIGQTDRSSGRKRHLKLLIEDNRDNDREEQM